MAVVAGSTYAYYLWDDLVSQRMNMAGHGVHQRTIYHFSYLPTANPISGAQLGWYLLKQSTDAGGIVPSAMLMTALPSTAIEEGLFEKELLEYQMRVFAGNITSPTSTAQPATFSGDVTAKRKLDDTDALMFVFTAQYAGTVWLAGRTYVTW